MASEIKVNKISPASGTAFTMGDSGDTFTIPSGATITNSGGTFTITPSTNAANAGTFDLRFKASDGLHIGSKTSTFSSIHVQRCVSPFGGGSRRQAK